MPIVVEDVPFRGAQKSHIKYLLHIGFGDFLLYSPTKHKDGHVNPSCLNLSQCDMLSCRFEKSCGPNSYDVVLYPLVAKRNLCRGAQKSHQISVFVLHRITTKVMHISLLG